ncbi:MAG TPA: hypothetical protein VN106_08540, partial [Sphingomicrobium sp.]|nr:hypothetical protein [Sphingomicrobium sp.]
GGGGGGQGSAIEITEPSGQVCVFGVVAHADTATVATIISAILFIRLSSHVVRPDNVAAAAVFRMADFRGNPPNDADAK